MIPSLQLINKYNQPVPRYTSYPTVPFWNESVNAEQYRSLLIKQFNELNEKEGISLYIHLPFCESLCTYCGCNKKITTNHAVENEYIPALLKEFDIYLKMFGRKPILRELHLGGGTPTFFSAKNLEKLIKSIKNKCILHADYEFSIEGHPNNTTDEHLQTLFDLGFRRISFGVQDLDYVVQRAINRIQPFENVKNVTRKAREIGFTSVNFDLIYGLPFQTAASIQMTVSKCLDLHPDRIAFYSYAHVPWTSRGQRLFDEADLPSAEQKLTLYLLGKRLFLANGYTDIGMDHFALEEDSLCIAANNKTLHRNFMGYTTQASTFLLGLGVSSISDIGNAFVQNDKALHNYYAALADDELPWTKGFILNEEDVRFRHYIKQISCNGEVVVEKTDLNILRELSFDYLNQLQEDELIILHPNGLTVTPLGKHFIRNICKAFDLQLLRKEKLSPVVKLFSNAM